MRLLYLIIGFWMMFYLAEPAVAKSKHKSAKKPIITHSSAKKPAVVKKRKPKLVKSSPAKVKVAAAPSAVYGGSQLARQLNDAINSVGDNANIGVFVKSMRYGDKLYVRNVNQSLTPASTLKVLTAAAALLFLKPEYRFSTQLLTDAKTIKNGVLQGNLYIVLNGDPSLTYNDLMDLLLNLKTQQIQAIAGSVYIDDTAYDQNFYGPDWENEDKNYCYAAPIGASIINHNCLPFRIIPSKVAGQAARVETSPNFFYPAIRNHVVTKPSHSRSCALHLSSDLSNGLEIEGCVSKGQDAWGVSYVVTDVLEYNRALFKNVLNQLSIQIYGTVAFGAVPKNSSLIAYHASAPLPELINDMLKKSDNVIAGALFKKVGQLYTRHPGSWGSGRYAVSQILSRYAGVNTAGLHILDGSGLSPSNLTTPAQMMQVLAYIYHHNSANDVFISALPIAGVDGTLKHRMGNIARKVRAKTGTISGVVSLAGYVVGADKEVLAFVIMVNGSKGMAWKYKEMEDKIATALTRYKR
ncbi:MAG: D-alanyl-D-alanine carboxypeptidase/D-alanyl-D-alanine-endopeptidase [Gammaproteobacteria bacterium]|nr:D-alanyl-D-alanine carboxypeptidase/D-alanyl-D-alanine-endopeptidase [Gammaproteobacteria bacterium]MCW5582652.1 D-alanyl-D-alanine carboxypeptidase/D-alanyl-D-alanine-endopeptidase [Gammaproteobacteria bacterium]